MSTDMEKINWPGWETVRLIGRGSFGSVYEIQRNVFGDVEKAALKVISIPQNTSDIDELYSDGYDDESITSTFQAHLQSIVAEYSLMRKMNGSTNIVNCDDLSYFKHNDGIGWDVYIKMELLTPLTKSLPDKIPEETVVKIAKDICAALELCRKHEIIHRDIKPQNIFVSPNGDYKLGDFGIAKTIEKTMGGTKIGTYKYMAPEVYNNQPYGLSADIYSLGLVLYWLLNERRMPFLPLPPEKLKAGMDEHARNRRLSGELLPPPAHGCSDLKRIVLKACAYDPSNRYTSAAEMLQDLNEVFTDEETRLRKEQEEQERLRREAEEAERLRREAEEVERLRREKEEAEKKGKKRNRKDPSNHNKKNNPVKKSILDNLLNLPKKTKYLLIGIVAALLVVIIVICCFFIHRWEEPTCTTPQTCSSCGKTKGVPLGHSYKVETIAATCTESGITTYTCSACGDSYKETLEIIPHSYEFGYCSVCGAEEPYYNGLKQVDGIWNYYIDGTLRNDYTGLVEFNSKWLYIENGTVNWNYCGLTLHYGNWIYVENGEVNWEYFGLIPHGSNWYYVENSKVTWSYTGLVQYNGNWYYVENSEVTWKYTGLVPFNGNLYYVDDSEVDWDYNGTVTYNGVRYKVVDGIAQT